MMTTNDKMTIDEVYKYLRQMRPAYEQANQTEKGRMLDDMERVTGRHWKSLIRLLRGTLERRPRQQQRERAYKADFDAALRRICAERLHPSWRNWPPNSPSTAKWNLRNPYRHSWPG